MQPLPPHVSERLAQAWQSLPESESLATGLLRELGALPAVDALLELVPYVFPELEAGLHQRIRRGPAIERLQRIASELAFELLAALRADELLNLDSQIRGRGSLAHRFGWRSFRPESIADDAAIHPAMLALLTLHPSGYVRAGAVRKLTQEAPDFGFPFVLLRANDWVDPVRREATFGVSKVLLASPARIIADALPLIARFDAFGRAQHEQLRSALRARLESVSGAQALDVLWSRDRAGDRRVLIRFLAGSPEALRRTFIERASNDSNPAVRLWAARELETLEKIDAPAAEALLARMAHDPSSAVRRYALYGFVRRGKDRAVPMLTGFVVDTAASVRYAARYYLRELGEQVPLLDLYRARLTGRVATMVAAIQGIAEIGSGAEFDLIEPLLQHLSTKVATASLRGVHRLDAQRARAHCLAATVDYRRPVRRCAFALLERRLAATDAPLLCALAGGVSTHAQAKDLVASCSRLPTWLTLLTLLELAARADAVVAPAATAALACWNPRGQPGYAAPLPDARTLELIGEQLASAPVPPPTMMRLRGLLRARQQP